MCWYEDTTADNTGAVRRKSLKKGYRVIQILFRGANLTGADCGVPTLGSGHILNSSLWVLGPWILLAVAASGFDSPRLTTSDNEFHGPDDE